MTFLGKMMRTKSKLLPLAVAVVIAPLLLSENAAAQDVNIHPSDLFETPSGRHRDSAAKKLKRFRQLEGLHPPVS